MRLLVTGISGLLGLNAAAALRDRCTVVGSFLEQPIELEGVRAVRLDVSDGEAVRRWIEAERPDVVLHTAGLTDVERCEADPDLAARLNVAASAHVAAAAHRAGARLVHVSTDHLFDGRDSLYVEDHPTSPLNVYASTKLAAEEAVRREHPGALVVRTNFYGWGSPRRRSFSDWIISSLRRGEGLRMFHDVHFTPLLANDFLDIVLELVNGAEPGVYNVAGGERLSKCEFAIALAERFGLDTSLIQSVSVETFAFKARRPHDMSLATDWAARRLGFPMPGVAAGIDRLARLERDGLPAVLAAALRPIDVPGSGTDRTRARGITT
jgi:dTDP-4-dehydrorhamnose reductase